MLGPLEELTKGSLDECLTNAMVVVLEVFIGVCAGVILESTGYLWSLGSKI